MIFNNYIEFATSVPHFDALIMFGLFIISSSFVIYNTTGDRAKKVLS